MEIVIIAVYATIIWVTFNAMFIALLSITTWANGGKTSVNGMFLVFIGNIFIFAGMFWLITI